MAMNWHSLLKILKGFSDDVLIFDSDVSKEYLRLYESQCLTAEELDNIRKNGLKPEFN